MKIGIPKIRLSRKMLLITIGLILALGGSATAALYFTTDVFSEKKEEHKAGATCTDIQTMVLKTPSNHLWLRKYIRMDNVDGVERVRTALRIAGLLAKDNAVDLIHVSVIDSKGPTKRAEMRDRSIGAEVLIAMKPKNLPEMAEPAEARYFEGNASDEGKFYGERVSLDFAEIRDMMVSMRKVPDKQDCAKPEPTEEEKAAAEKKAKEHGEKKKSEHGEKPAEHGEKPAEHGEQPAEHGDKPAEHGADPKEGDAAADAHGAEPAKEKGFLDSMLGMVGLGSDEPPAAEHAAEDGKDHGEKPSGDHEAASEKTPADHEGTADEPAADHAATEKTTAEDHAEAPAPAHEESKDTSAEHEAQDTSEHAGNQPDDHAASERETVSDHSAEDAPAEDPAQLLLGSETDTSTEHDTTSGEHEPTTNADHAAGDGPSKEHDSTDKAADPEKQAKDEHATPAKEKGFLDGMMDMVGLGSDEAAAETPATTDAAQPEEKAVH